MAPPPRVPRTIPLLPPSSPPPGWRDVKFQKKAELAAHIKDVTGYEVSTAPMFDVQASRDGVQAAPGGRGRACGGQPGGAARRASRAPRAGPLPGSCWPSARCLSPRAAVLQSRTSYPSHLSVSTARQVKRIHEYKRQFMNAISIIARYKAIKEMSPEERAKVGAGGGRGLA